MVYSSLQAFDELVASGIPEHQARAIVQTQERRAEDLATKGDLDQLRTDMEKMFWRAMAIQTGIGITIAAAAVAIAEAL